MTPLTLLDRKESVDFSSLDSSSQRRDKIMSTEFPNRLFSFPGRVGGIAIDGDGTAWVSDTASATIWRIGADGSPRRFVDSHTHGIPLKEGRVVLFAPAGLALSPDGSLYVADSTGHRVCAVDPDGAIRTVAGGANGYRDGIGEDAMFRYPQDVAFAPDGTCYVADTGNDRIRAISPDGTVTTVAGSIYDYGDGRGPHGRFRRPSALDFGRDGNCYVADTGNNAIRRISSEGMVSTFAGSPPGGDFNGIGRSVGLRWPTGIAVALDSSVWVADHGNGALRHITDVGMSTTELLLSGLRWPVVVALSENGTPVVAGTGFKKNLASESCVIVVRGGIE